MNDFILDVEKIRRNARDKVEEGAVTDGYQADRGTVIELLKGALATEWICVLRYTQHQIAAVGLNAQTVAAHFGEHAAQEQQHAMQLAERIKQLGGHPSLDPANFKAASHAEYKECDSLVEMIRENLVAERIAIESYTEIIRYLGDSDPTSRRMLEEILATEEEHADEMADLLVTVDPHDKLN
jgi:bacterioferritin